MFNTTAATTYVVNSATQITATVPTGATTGPLHVTTHWWRSGEQRDQLHRGHGTHDHVVHADERSGGDERHDHRYEPHRGDGGQVQRGHSGVHDEHRDLGDRDRSVGRDDR